MKNNNKSNEKYPKTSRCEAVKNEFLHISHTAMFKLDRLFDMSALFSLNKFSDQTWGTLGALWGPAGLPGPPRAPCRRPRPWSSRRGFRRWRAEAPGPSRAVSSGQPTARSNHIIPKGNKYREVAKGVTLSPFWNNDTSTFSSNAQWKFAILFSFFDRGRLFKSFSVEDVFQQILAQK